MAYIKNKLQKVYYTGIFALLLLSGAQTTHAVQISNPLGSVETFEQFVSALLSIVVRIGFPIVVLAIVYAGFLFVKAQGNDPELQKAKTAFFWTIIGAFVLLGAQVLSLAVQGTIEQLK